MTTSQKTVHAQVEKYGRTKEYLIPILQGIIDEERFLSKEALREVARELDMSAAEVFGTATFYSFLDTEVRGKYIIRICKTIVCEMKGEKSIVRTIQDMLKIKVGETTSDRRFSLLETNCLGLCHMGPAMLINDEPYTELTPHKVREIIGDYIRNGH